jgi:hypothetical protein
MTIYPTVLYIKQHSITGLKYFGKTTRNPYKYNGSGDYWTNHIKKHGRKHIITTWVSEPYIDSNTISEFALAFSKDNNIVESSGWANLKPENGLNGGITGRPSGRKGRPSGRKGVPSSRKGVPSGRKGIPNGPNGKKGIPTGPNGKKGKPSGKKGIPNGKKGKPSGKKGIPTGPRGKQKNPATEVECPHCGLVGRGSNMTRHHFGNCKMKPVD